MRKSLIATVALAALAATALVASAAALGATSTSTKIIPFNAKYAGTATAKVTDNVADIAASGSGTGTLLGSGKISGVAKGDASSQPCVPFAGPGTMMGTAGTKLTFTVLQTSQGCGDEAGQVFSITGKAKVVKGYGKLKNAKGTLKFTGIYDRGAGTFSVKFTGSLTKA